MYLYPLKEKLLETIETELEEKRKNH